MKLESNTHRAISVRSIATLGLLLAGTLMLADTAIAQNFERSGPPSQSTPMPSGDRDMGPPPGSEPPFNQIARELGLSVDKVREAFRKVGPPGTPGQRPTEAQLAQHAQKLASALNVSPDKLRTVLDRNRPQPPSRQ